MPAITLTSARIMALKPRARPYDTRDREIPGLVVRTQPSGVKSFNLRYRTNDGSQRTIKLGAAQLGIGAARKIALGRLAEVADGGDPAVARRASRRAARTATEQAGQRRLRAYLDGPYARHVMAEQKRGPETIARITAAFAGFLDLDLEAITEVRVKDWRSDRLKAGIARTTVDREVSMLSTLLGHAVRVTGLLPMNPLSGIKPLVKGTARTNALRFLDDDEEARLRDGLGDRDADMRAARARMNAWRAARSRPALPDYPAHYADHLEPIVLVLLGTGLRFSEMTQLRWSVVDFRTRLLTVQGSTTKTELTRYVPLNDEMVAILSRWRARTPARPQDLVFPGASGGVLVDIKTAWATLLKRAGIEKFRIHDLRHTFASRLVQRGVDLYRVQKLLGHASPTMTMRYSHLMPNHLADAVAVLDRPTTATGERTAVG
jgi:integrase